MKLSQELTAPLWFAWSNAKEANRHLTYTEMSGMSVHVIMLCQELLRHKRAALITGGRADLWELGDEWGNIVQKMFSH